jgi:hypothetical protein
VTTQPPPADESVAEFTSRLKEAAREAREIVAREAAATASDESRLWAALVPGWTVELGRLAGYPTRESGGVGAFFDRLTSGGEMDRHVLPSIDVPSPDRSYYIMTDRARSETIQAVLPQLSSPDEPTMAGSTRRIRAPQSQFLKALGTVASRFVPEQRRTAAGLLSLAARIASQIQRRGADADVPAEVRRWAQLASAAEDPAAVVHAFEAALKPSVVEGDVATIRDWIQVARPLAVLMEYAGNVQLSVAIGQAGRQVELVKRQRIDFGHLEAFHRRDEQVEVVRALLDGPDEQWALHLIGPGGVGKTMIIRYASCLMTQAPNSPCSADPRPFEGPSAVARVDFDYLNLDYPQINPGLLLVQLAAELRVAGQEQTEGLFDRAEADFKLLNEAQKAEGFRRGKRATLDPLMRSGIEKYIEALRSINKRVVLILDTCEELAKVDEGRGDSMILEETFRILRALHDGPDALEDKPSAPGSGVPSLRVILSGRRPLASGNGEWSIEGSRLPVRPFLRIHQIRGFPKRDARAYLKAHEVPAKLLTPVVTASSPDLDMAIDLRIPGSKTAARSRDRCNPYLLRLYMDWALADPAPPPRAITRDGLGRYVELRLLQRLGDAGLEDVLPIVSLLGHIDRPTLAEIAGASPSATDDLWVALENQEWISSHRSEGEPPRDILDMAPDFRDLLQRYYATRPPTRDQIETAIQAVEDLTLGVKHSTIDWSDFDAGLRVMALQPDRGAAWWANVESQLFNTHSHWIGELLGHLLSTEGAARAAEPNDPVGLPENPLRPFVLATRARTRAIDGDAAAAAEDWRVVAADISDRLGSPAIDRLFRRALAGRIAASRSSGALPPAELVRSFWRDWRKHDVMLVDPADAASMLAAVEALVDLAELYPARAGALLALPRSKAKKGPSSSGPRWLLHQVQSAIATWLVNDPERHAALSALEAAARVVAGRADVLLGDTENAVWAFREALELAPSGPLAAPWVDWQPAANPRLRARLEVARAANPSLLSPSGVLNLVGADDGALDTSTADGDRLASTLIRLALADGLGDVTDAAQRWQDPSTGEAVVSTTEPADMQPINAHLLVPPLFASVAELFVANGNFGPARGLLQGVLAASESPTGPSLETRRHAERGLLQLARRLRSREGADPLDTSLASSSDPSDVALTGELLGLAGPTIVTERTGAAAGDANAAWRCAYIVDRDSAERVLASSVRALRAALKRTRDPLDRAALYLDLQEALTIAQVHGIGFADLGVRPPEEISLDRPATALPGWDEKMLRLVLREAGLTGFGLTTDAHRHLIDRLGPRRAAEIAFQEGELLGLRVPTPAALILDAAASLYREANDAFGRFRSLTLSAMFLARSLPFDRWPDEEFAAANIVEWLRRDPRVVTDRGGRFSPSVDFLGQIRAAIDSWEDMTLSLGERPATPRPVALEAIADVVEHPTPEGLGRLDDPELGPWIVRLAACLAVARDLVGGSADGPSTEGIQAWVGQQYGAVTTQGVVLPTEWIHFATRTMVEPVPEPDGVDGPREPDGAGAVRGGLLRGLVNAFFGRLLVGVIGLVVGLLVVAFLLWRLAVGAVFPTFIGGRGIFELILWFAVSVPAAVVGLVLALRLIRRVIRRASDFYLPIARLDITVERNEQSEVESAAARTTTVRITPTSWRAWPTLAFPPWRIEAVLSGQGEDMVLGDGETYAQLASRVPPKLRNRLRPLGVLPAGHLHVRVMPQGDLQALPWEAIVTLAVTPEKASPKRAAVRVSRVPDASRFVVEEPRKRLRLLSVAATEAGSALVSRAVERAHGNFDWTVVSQLPEPPVQGVETAPGSAVAQDSLKPPDIVHLIGIVASDHTGPGLRLVPERTYGSQLARQSARSTEQSTSRLLRPSELRSRYPSARLFIVQGHPPDDTNQRLASDRQAANLARLFGADLARKGTRVIVIPPVEATVGSDVLGLLYALASDLLAKGATAILPRITKVQEAIFEGGDAARQWMWELALDVCVYDIPDRPVASVQV